MKNSTHAVIIRGSYVDQRYGNYKGRLYIIGSRASRQHRIVAISLVAAKHHETTFALEIHCPSTLSSKDDESAVV
jgi:hypothetical protein